MSSFSWVWMSERHCLQSAVCRGLNLINDQSSVNRFLLTADFIKPKAGEAPVLGRVVLFFSFYVTEIILHFLHWRRKRKKLMIMMMVKMIHHRLGRRIFFSCFWRVKRWWWWWWWWWWNGVLVFNLWVACVLGPISPSILSYQITLYSGH